LPGRFPLLRPDSGDFEDWLTAHGGELPTRELFEAAVNVLSVAERERISGSYAGWFPQEWARLVAGVRDEAAVNVTVLVGAVAAALAEPPLPDGLVLDLLEVEPGLEDPSQVLALCLEATDLWSVAEAVTAGQAIAAIPDELDEDAYARRWEAVLEREAARLLTKRHRRRLGLLVARLRGELPLEEFPAASHAIELACAAFERDRRMPARVAAMLFADTLGPLRWQQLRFAA
jgi:hypothetical protein